MLKHMLNSASSATANHISESSAAKQVATISDGSSDLLHQTQHHHHLHHHHQHHHHPSQEPLNADDLRHSVREVVAEPEYQNTRTHSAHAAAAAAGAADFYRSVPFNKSVRSLENVCEAANASRSQRTPDMRWNRAATATIANDAAAAANSRYYRASMMNHSYPASVHSYPLIVAQSPPPPPPPHRLNHTLDGVNLHRSAGSPLHSADGPIKVIANGGLHISKGSPATPVTPTHLHQQMQTDSSTDISKYNNNNNCNITVAANQSVNQNNNNNNNNNHHQIGCGEGSRSNGIKEILTSLGLLCLISLLLALLSLIFLLKISPVTAADMKDLLRAEQFTIISPEEYITVYEVTLALCALSLSLNLCCLLVCSVQFLFAVKLTRSSFNGDRTNKYLQKSAITRVCAIAGFFISIPVFLTGVILYTFIQFHSTPAIITSVLIGSGIVFCGCAMVHNVFVWQKEKTNAVKDLVQKKRLNGQLNSATRSVYVVDADGTRNTSGCALNSMSALPLHLNGAGMNSSVSTPHELSTLV